MTVRSGLSGSERQTLQGTDQARVGAAEHALVGAGRIRETVADDPASLGERWRDRVFEMIAMRAAAKSSASPVGPSGTAGAREDHVADDLGARRAARLARGERPEAGLFQPLGQQADLGRLAAALPALQRDEPSPFQAPGPSA